LKKVPPMKLSQLFGPYRTARRVGEDVAVTGIQTDSRLVRPGDLFVCIPGFRTDGHQFAREAVAKGAVALVVEREVPVEVPKVFVRDARRALAFAADRFYGHPTRELKLIGVTGTNGKTTTTHLLTRILEEAGHTPGLIGTMAIRYAGREEPAVNTTPDALVLQRTFRAMVDAGVDYAVMEVSSHALALGRVRGCRFRTAVFTNLTQDHLDFHQTMEAYKQAKGLLFAQLAGDYRDGRETFAVLNADDPIAEEYAALTAAQVLTYGMGEGCDVRARDVQVTPAGVSFRLESFAGAADVELPLVGHFNVYNALAAVTAALAEGIPLETAVRALADVTVRGRFEKVDEGQPFTVIVDYAHTPDGLANVLKAARALTSGRVIVVVGCGGDRDRTKRPVMARIAVAYADLAVFTSDNPRSEDPERILDEMEAGVPDDARTRTVRLTDRRAAIRYAIDAAKPGDLVLIAGKGHETYQIIGDRVLPFDDVQEAREALRGRGW